ncbi:MAG: hypothetical protein ACE5H1_09585 [Thermodesulfobacteriota bacterium]
MKESKNNVEEVLEKSIAEKKDIATLLKDVAKLALESDKEPWLKKISKDYGITLSALRKDLKSTEQKSFRNKDTDSDSRKKEICTPIEIEESEKLLKSPKILDQMLKHTEDAGYVAERKNKLILFLAIISRLFDRAISCILKGESSAGKSALVGIILKFFPKEIIEEASILTPKALYHFEGDFSHKVLYIHEHEGAKGANYPIRLSLSEGKIIWLGTVKDEVTGALRTVRKEIPAEGLVIIETTTQRIIDPENETRFFTLNIDDSKEQTEKILDIQGEQAEGLTSDKATQEKNYRVWRCAHRMLEPYDVIVPFATKIAKRFPTDLIRVRRDFPAVISIIRSHALLHQKQRIIKDGKLIADSRDLEGVKDLIIEVLKPSLAKLTTNELRVLNIIKDKVDFDKNTHYSTKELHELIDDEYKIGYSTLKDYVVTYRTKGHITWNRQTAAGSLYDVSPLADSPIFASNLLESLNNLISELAKDEKANLSQLTIYDQTFAVAQEWSDELDWADEQIANSTLNKSINVNRLAMIDCELADCPIVPS